MAKRPITHERRNGPTPNGGDYSEIYYMDDDHNYVDKSTATQFVIRECKANGDLIMETWGMM